MKALIYKALSTWWSLARQQTVSLQLVERCDNYMANSVTSLSTTPTWQSLLLTARGIPPCFVGCMGSWMHRERFWAPKDLILKMCNRLWSEHCVLLYVYYEAWNLLT